LNRSISPRVLFTVAVGAGWLALSPPAPAQSEPTAAPPASPSASAETDGNAEAAPTASATAEASAGTEVKPNFEATSKTGADATNAPSPTNPVETAPNTWRCSGPGHQGDHPEFADRNCYSTKLAGDNMFLYGGLELDVGYAGYDFRDNPTTPSESYRDMRGRFVIGPLLRHDFGDSGYFLEATGQVVAWLRDRPGSYYQVNVDDVWGKFGHTGGPGTNWDFQVGRFMTWRVYHRGLGFDLYTLEDAGALFTPGASNGVYGVHTYEVNYIYERRAPAPVPGEIAGRAALHYYPHRSLGFELAGAYGGAADGLYNTAGGRLAADFHRSIGPLLVRASAGGEFRVQEPAQRTLTQNPTTQEYVECLDCNVAVQKGFGGGAIIKLGPAEISGSIARGYELRHAATSGTDDPQHSARVPQDTADRTSFGGYVELDPGRYLIKRSLIVGVGLQHSEIVRRTNDYQTHIQGAAYIAYRLGFNEAMVKLVLSRAELDNYQRTSAAGAAQLVLRHTESAMTAARVRLSFPF
jgi:hypothetical protein